MKWNSPQCVFAMILLFSGIILSFLSFYTEPKGEISDSVLWYMGQALIWSGGMFGMKAYCDGKFITFKNDLNKTQKDA